MNAPVEAVGVVPITKFDVEFPPDGGVIGEGRTIWTPAGAAPTHELERATATLKPFTEATVHVLVPLPPCATVIDDGAHPIVKSGVIGESLATLFTPDSSIQVFPEESTTTSCG